MATGSGGPDGGAGPDLEMSRYMGQPNTIYRAPQSVANQNTANAVKKRRSSNPGRAAMTGLGMIGKLGTGSNPFMPFGFGPPLAGPAVGALLHGLMNKPGFNYDPQGAGKEASRDIRRLGSIYPKSKADKRSASMKPSLDEQVGDSGKTRRQLQQEHAFHPGGPLAFSLAHREYLDPDIRKRLAEVIPEDAIVHFREVGQGGNRFTDVMSGGSRISRTPGHMLPVHEAFGLPMQKFYSGGDVTGGGYNMRSKRAAELLHEAFGLPVQRFYSGGSAQSGGREGRESPGSRSSRGSLGGGGGPSAGSAGMATGDPTGMAGLGAIGLGPPGQEARDARARAAARASYAPDTMDFNARLAADAARASYAPNTMDFNARQKDKGFFSPYTGGELHNERAAASPGPDFDFLQNQAASGIAGLLPGVSDSPAGTGGESSYYDAVRLASITGITVPQALSYLNSMYGTA